MLAQTGAKLEKLLTQIESPASSPLFHGENPDIFSSGDFSWLSAGMKKRRCFDTVIGPTLSASTVQTQR